MTVESARSSTRQWWVLAGFAAAVALVALVGGLAVARPADDYAALARPGWAPPAWVFGPVWTLLYAMIALAGWLVWRAVGWGPQLVPYAIQLVLNAAWTPLFFGAGLRGAALVDIVALWLAIGATVAVFRKVSPVAAWLLVPYWLWVTFATALNFSIWQLNRG
ncbi:putative TspO/MBR-related protein precursor [Catellatospora sp. TT07R-123]|uniref:TspO/MBR family protein n=1 Tax=Catellatospora sp. TT07R-123 TaxID=2733863 RepID=UPI001B2B6317|nr:TspO/MBR family protein [Catellatospora sp. TT07R-123]GHJ45833.1 putative TspO/MBR-related protein precursor [Catellatospora sp. TT07R-123]